MNRNITLVLFAKYFEFVDFYETYKYEITKMAECLTYFKCINVFK